MYFFFIFIYSFFEKYFFMKVYNFIFFCKKYIKTIIKQLFDFDIDDIVV